MVRAPVVRVGEKLPSLAAQIGLIAVKHNMKNCHLFPFSGPGVMESEMSTKNAVCVSQDIMAGTERWSEGWGGGETERERHTHTHTHKG